MRRRNLRIGMLTAALGGVALMAEALDYIVPTNGASAYGNVATTIPCLSTSGRRYQQVFHAGQFAGAQRPQLVRGVRFRLATVSGTSYLAGSPMDVRLSTTSRNPDGLSATFADNPGADETLVYSGTNWQFMTASGLGRFYFSIFFQQPFHYDRSQGNLLLDIRMPGSYSFSGYSFDATNATGDSVSRLYANVTNATSGTADSTGVFAEFVFLDTQLTNVTHATEAQELHLRWLSVSNAEYRVQGAETITGSYANLSSPITGRAPVNVATQALGSAYRFFRIMREK
ncbi:MAG TPA: hypothetical protein PKE12_02840 [Kiritimatiellia bacterium]|nr:hypothetical protein [Kiritimatiellia bacterium]